MSWYGLPLAELIGNTLVRAGALRVDFRNPVQLRSGELSPLYVDCRRLLAYPSAMTLIAGWGHTKFGKLTDMSLEALMNIEVTSVSKKPEKQTAAAAAIYVISNADLRRWGVKTIPDALRRVPGLQVARIIQVLRIRSRTRIVITPTITATKVAATLPQSASGTGRCGHLPRTTIVRIAGILTYV